MIYKKKGSPNRRRQRIIKTVLLNRTQKTIESHENELHQKSCHLTKHKRTLFHNASRKGHVTNITSYYIEQSVCALHLLSKFYLTNS